MIKKALWMFFFLACIFDMKAQTNVLFGNVGDLGLNPLYRSQVTLTLQSPNPRTSGNFLVSQAPVSHGTDTNGAFYFTNVLWGLYQISISGNPGTAFTFTVYTNTVGSNAISGLITNVFNSPPYPVFAFQNGTNVGGQGTNQIINNTTFDGAFEWGNTNTTGIGYVLTDLNGDGNLSMQVPGGGTPGSGTVTNVSGPNWLTWSNPGVSPTAVVNTNSAAFSSLKVTNNSVESNITAFTVTASNGFVGNITGNAVITNANSASSNIFGNMNWTNAANGSGVTLIPSTGALTLYGGPLTIAPSVANPYTNGTVAMLLPNYAKINLGAGIDNIFINPTHGPATEIQFEFSSRGSFLMGYDQQHAGALQIGASTFGVPQGAACPVYFTGDKFPNSTGDNLGYSELILFNCPYYDGSLEYGNITPGFRTEAVDTNGGSAFIFYEAVNRNPLIGQSPGAKMGLEIWSNGNVQHGRLTADLSPVSTAANYGVNWDGSANVELDLSQNLTITNVPFTYARTNQSDTITLYLYPGLAAPMVTFPASWNWASPGPEPTNVPAGGMLKVSVTALTTTQTNYIARSEVYPFTPVVDANAAKFFTAAANGGSGSISSVESNAVNQLAINLKSAGLWTAWDAIYPMVGNSSNTMSWNLANTNNFRISWTLGSSTFASVTGWTSDGTASFGETHFNPSTATSPNYVQDSASVFVYTGLIPSISGTPRAMSASDGTHRAGIAFSSTPSLTIDGMNNNNNAGGIVINYSTLSGSILATRTGSTTEDLYGNTSVGGSATASGVPNRTFYIGGRNSGSFDSGLAASFRMEMLGSGLTTPQFNTLTNIVYQFETALGRP